jgi:hypothetical protein
MKEYDFANASRRDLILTTHHRVKMQIAHGAAREPAKLQMNKPGRIGDADVFAGDALKPARADAIANTEFAGTVGHRCVPSMAATTIWGEGDPRPRD